MQAKSHKHAGARFAVCTAMAAAMVAGLVAFPELASAGTIGSPSVPTTAKVDARQSNAVATAERAVAKAPRSAVARARLAQAYLAAGRFASAATTFEDATALGDTSGPSQLGQALAYLGTGRNAEALTLLQQSRDALPAGDYGLALALAGQPADAVDVLTDAIGKGEDTAKVRQNLAYAYALAGRWGEAKVIAAHDVPADQLDARLSQWALQSGTDGYQARIASLLGAPVRSDPGQPAALALAGEQPQHEAQPAMAVADAPATELPASPADAPAMPMAMNDAAPAAAAPVPAAAEMPAAAPDVAPEVAPAAPAPAARLRFVSNPVIQDIAQASAPQPATGDSAVARVAARHAKAQARALAEAPAAAQSGTHLVQLGAFSSEANARRAWDHFVKRDASLRDHQPHITQAVVRGKRYWRVAAAGFDAGSARTMCSAVRGRGGDCFAYAEIRGLPGVAPTRAVPERLAQR